MREKHILVVGRGVAGLSCGMRLAEAGFKVTVVGEARPGEASSVASGVAAVKGLVLAEKPLFACKLQGHRQLPALIAELSRKSGRPIAHALTGAYELFADAASYSRLRSRVYHRQFSACFSFDVLAGAQLANRSQLLADLQGKEGAGGAFFYPQDGWFDPLAYLEALAAVLAGAGGLLLTDSVRKITSCPQGKLRVEGHQQVYEADAVVLACGAFTSDLLAASGLKPLPLMASPGQILTARCPGEAYNTVVKLGSQSLVMQDGKLVFGAYDYPKNQALTGAGLAAGAATLNAALDSFLPAPLQALLTGKRTQAGVRVMARDRKPVLGFWPFAAEKQGVFLVTGLHKSGFYLADIFARGLVELLKNSRYDPLTAAFTTARFFR